ncbi:BUB3-interacting and GLEBS motif-containing protein [Babesia sp. Xinjiang]|uniref:BUB3-interacting and GLEBS motif-containing protein n=1 Tax=Babesia sp. Xinjiang TaxID=462227 RepID=UPI000A221AA0|nr:BUB3-interacting and GLEBS motif-containing protein [Babesia sp. Xinjiang]ORM39661.1 BUB3-interacting and GLEBS motif-containing protein [Babesia sp. Xinjiang]
MGRKSSRRLQLKPFCYFCNREFDDEKILIMHQKAKHFKCPECNRKLETANGLAVHMQQVHKLIQRKVPFALESRDNITSVVQGMQGVPFEAIEEHRMKYQKKLGDIDTKKQQRIIWAIVSTAPTPEQFLAQLSIGNVYFPGFTAPQENEMPQQQHPVQNTYGQMPPYQMDMMTNYPHQGPYPQPPMHAYGTQPPMPYQTPGYAAHERRGRRFPNGPENNTFQPRDDFTRQKGFGHVGSGPLILGPSGQPIDPSRSYGFTPAPPATRPTPITTGGPIAAKQGFTSAPKGFSNAPTNAAINPPARGGFSDNSFQRAGGFTNPNNFQRSGGFSDAPTTTKPPQGFSKNDFSRPKGFSDAPTTTRPTQGFSSARGIPDSTIRQAYATEQRERRNSALNAAARAEEETKSEKQKVVQTQHYRPPGVAPLFIPPPTLANTKLACDVDSESIEERRAKLFHNWKGSA